MEIYSSYYCNGIQRGCGGVPTGAQGFHRSAEPFGSAQEPRSRRSPYPVPHPSEKRYGIAHLFSSSIPITPLLLVGHAIAGTIPPAAIAFRGCRPPEFCPDPTPQFDQLPAPYSNGVQ
jgi:hypothetical protein